MTKAEFIKEITGHFCRIEDGEKSFPFAEIRQRRNQLHAQDFADWLRTESESADAERRKNPLLFDTQKEAAEALAAQVERETGCTDWVDHLNGFLTTFYSRPGRQWENREPFVRYVESVKAAARADAFTSYNSGMSITEYLPDLRKEYDRVKDRPHLVKDPRKSSLYSLYASILAEAKQQIAADNAPFLSNEDREMILHFFDLVSPEMLHLVQNAKEDYNRQMIAFEAHLRQNGFIIPADFSDFADWFFGVRFRGVDLQSLVSVAKVAEHHFAEFSAWKEGRLKAEPDSKPAPKAEPPAFADLFVMAEAMEKALQAAQGIEPPMIYANNQWTGDYKKLPGLLAFYEFCNDKDYLKTPTNKKSVIQAFAFHFTGKEAGKNALQAKPDSRLKGKLLLFGRSKDRENRDSRDSL
jgi:hypothetical protein